MVSTKTLVLECFLYKLFQSGGVGLVVFGKLELSGVLQRRPRFNPIWTDVNSVGTGAFEEPSKYSGKRAWSLGGGGGFGAFSTMEMR